MAKMSVDIYSLCDIINNMKVEDVNKTDDVDKFVEKVKYYHEHKDEIKHQKRKEEYLTNQREYGEFLENNTYVGKILKENGYQIFDIRQAQEDFRKVMKLDKINEIAGVYHTTKFKKDMPVKTEHIERITKANYWNAFYEPIWENLSDSEKIKSLEWMFEDINEKYNLGIKQIDYFIPNDLDTLDMIPEKDLPNTGGAFVNSEDNVEKILFLNLDFLSEPLSFFKMPATLAHELMHARQKKYVSNFNYENPRDFYTLSQTEFGKISFFELSLQYKLNDATEFALYRVCQSEKTAELMALKTISKFKKLNEQKFGKNKLIDKSIDASFNVLKNDILFEDTAKTGKKNHKRFEQTLGIVTNEQVVLHGQSENLLKLIILKNFYDFEKQALVYSQECTKKEIYSLKEDFKNNKIGFDEFNKKSSDLKDEYDRLTFEIYDDEEKLSFIKSTFISTLKNGKLPEDFDEKKEFAVLNLIEEPKKEYSLPKWLHEDEDKKSKHINSQKKKYEKLFENIK